MSSCSGTTKICKKSRLSYLQSDVSGHQCFVKLDLHSPTVFWERIGLLIEILQTNCRANVNKCKSQKVTVLNFPNRGNLPFTLRVNILFKKCKNISFFILVNELMTSCVPVIVSNILLFRIPNAGQSTPEVPTLR